MQARKSVEANDLDSVARVAGTFVDGWKYEAEGRGAKIVGDVVLPDLNVPFFLSFFQVWQKG